MKAIIFAGGIGTRLWPLSRKKSPKQFEKIIGEKSTLQFAANRLQPDFSWNDIYISTAKKYVPLIYSQLPDVPRQNIIGEPEMRDVGPAVGLVAALLSRVSPHEPMVILWSDHLVKNEKLFRDILTTSGKVISKNLDKIILVSQKPRFASGNLGWIEFGDKVFSQNNINFFKLIDYQYRPDLKTAIRYFKSGHHTWNLGYFVTTPSFLWKQYQRYAPNLSGGLGKIAAKWGSAKYDEVLDKIYPTLEKISFDNAILEKLAPENVLVVSENIEWSDIGAWEALKEALADSQNNNVTQGKVLLNDTADSLVYNFTGQTVVTIDINNMLVINMNDVVLVCPKTSVPKIKKFVEALTKTEFEHLT